VAAALALTQVHLASVEAEQRGKATEAATEHLGVHKDTPQEEEAVLARQEVTRFQVLTQVPAEQVYKVQSQVQQLSTQEEEQEAGWPKAEQTLGQGLSAVRVSAEAGTAQLLSVQAG
jgi:hypothetical protein